jgi:hypothetical protein
VALLIENNELEVIIYILLKDIYRGFSWGYVLKVWKIIFWNDKSEWLVKDKDKDKDKEYLNKKLYEE